MSRRSGLSLLELLIVVGILALLVGLTLSAIQKVREAGLRTKTLNNQRQLVLGFHNYATAHGDGLPGLKNWDGRRTRVEEEDALFKVVAPYLENPIDFKTRNMNLPGAFYFPAVVDAADPSWSASPAVVDGTGNCSYAINPCAFQGPNRSLGSGFPDGTSQTIAISMHYMRCGTGERSGHFNWAGSAGSRGTRQRRATFADPFYGDVLPRTTEGEATQPSRWATFQAAPPLAECDPSIPQSPYRSGLVIAMMDGSVRTVKPSISVVVFWSAVTPDGREKYPLD